MAEDIAVFHMEHNGFNIIERNYSKKWGEIDIVAEKNGKIHFVEVKSSFPNVPQSYIFEKNDSFGWKLAVSRETDVPRETVCSFDPAWNMTNKKKLSLSRVIRTYLEEKYRENIPEFQIDLLSVSLDFFQKMAYINEIENIIIE